MTNNILDRIEALREKIEPPFSQPFFLVPMGLTEDEANDYILMTHLMTGLRHKMPFQWLCDRFKGMGKDVVAEMPNAEAEYTRLTKLAHCPSFL